MQYLTTFRHLFQEHQSAFHLETEDSYGPTDENEQMQRFLAGEPIIYPEGWQSWDRFIQDITTAGKVVRRLRIVTEPHTDYTRFLLHHTDRNVEAGEDVRYLPRHLINETDYTTDDWWLFDNGPLAFTVFDPGGEFVGGAVTTDSVIIDRCIKVRDNLWPLGIPFDTYIRDHG